MAFYYVSIFEENGKYEPKFDTTQTGQINAFVAGLNFGPKPLYAGKIQNEQQGKAVLRFLEEANKAGTFDKKKLEELLEAEK